MGGISHALPQAFQGDLAQQSTELLGVVGPGIFCLEVLQEEPGLSLLPLHRKGFSLLSFYLCD